MNLADMCLFQKCPALNTVSLCGFFSVGEIDIHLICVFKMSFASAGEVRRLICLGLMAGRHIGSLACLIVTGMDDIIMCVLMEVFFSARKVQRILSYLTLMA